MSHDMGSLPRVAHQVEKTEHLRSQKHLVDEALACETIFRTFSGRSTDSGQEPTCVEPTARAGGAKSFCSP